MCDEKIFSEKNLTQANPEKRTARNYRAMTKSYSATFASEEIAKKTGNEIGCGIGEIYFFRERGRIRI